MAVFTRQQGQEMFKKAEQQGISRDVIFKQAVAQGHSFEGLDSSKVLAELSGAQNTQKDTSVKQGAPGVVRGLGKSALGLARGAGELGEKTANALIGKGFETNENSIYNPESAVGSKLKEAEKATTPGEKVGKVIGDVAQFAIPGSKVAKATSAAPKLGKLAARAATDATVASLQTGDVGKEAAIAAGTDVGLYGAGQILKPAARLIGRLFKGTASALSGAPVSQIDDIMKNPEVAKEFSKKEGQDIIKENAKTILNGVSNIRKEASKNFDDGITALSKTDIKPEVFREQTQSFLDKYGSKLVKGQRVLGNVEFDDPKNLKKASDLIDRLSKADLDGKSLRKLADDVQSTLYKTATSDERLAFNAFIKDFSQTLKGAITKSTDKLDEINKAYSKDIQLAEATEKIFGKVKFKNLDELRVASEKLESLFKKKGMTPEIIDNFLTRIGVSPDDFKTSEAVRQMGNLEQGPNTIGANPFEIIRSFTSSVITPKMVRDLSIKTGLAEQKLGQVLSSLEPTARAAFLELVLGVTQ